MKRGKFKHQKKKKLAATSCWQCPYDEFIPIGEGDHVCGYEGSYKMVVSDYEPTEDWLHCVGGPKLN